jgi:hypothetical protein
MLKRKLVELTILSGMILCVTPARTQEAPASGFYQIVSGGFAAEFEVFGGPFHPLPDTNQSYVELVVDVQRNLVQMAILGEDQHTVTLPFFFTDGMVLPDHVQFGGEIGVPEEPYLNYTVSNSAGGLRIDGILDGPTSPVRIPSRYEHVNVIAVRVTSVPKPKFGPPRATTSGAVEFNLLDGRWGQTNIIEASTDLLTWTAISTNVFPVTVCPICPSIDFQEPANLPRRYYRCFSSP